MRADILIDGLNEINKNPDDYEFLGFCEDGKLAFFRELNGNEAIIDIKVPVQVGDHMYVRETWAIEENIYYIALMWFNGNPVVDGCRAYKTKEQALKYIDGFPEYHRADIKWTIPRVAIITGGCFD